MTTSQKSVNAEQFWLKHIKQWQDSGLSQTAYCQEHALKHHSLSYHKCKQARKQTATSLAKPISTGFLEVALPPMMTLPEPLTLHFADGLKLTGLTASNLCVAKELAEVLR